MNDIQALMSSLAGVAPTARWSSHNCPACIHNGQPANDTRSRGGQYHGADGSFSFHCFNCGFKAHWKPGWKVSGKLSDLAHWYGATDQQVLMLGLAAEEIIESGDYTSTSGGTSSYIKEHFAPKKLPDTARPFSEWAAMQPPPGDFVRVVQSIAERNPSILQSIDLWWSPDTTMQLSHRFLIPFYMHENPIGYTGRLTWKNAKNRYFNQYPTNVLYNFDILNDKNIKDIYVTEGPIDASLIGGVATCHYTMKDNHLDWLKQCGKNIIIVPDRDANGPKMVEQAIQNKFSVALPEWDEPYTDQDGNKRKIKDVDEAVQTYGRLYNMHLIKQSTYNNEMDIRVQAARWF